jgi:hypothetical protein
MASRLEEIERDIIYKMYKRKIIGGVHKSPEDIARWFRKDMRGSVGEALKALVRSSIVVRKPSSYGARFSLNRDRLIEIERILDEYVDNQT